MMTQEVQAYPNSQFILLDHFRRNRQKDHWISIPTETGIKMIYVDPYPIKTKIMEEAKKHYPHIDFEQEIKLNREEKRWIRRIVDDFLSQPKWVQMIEGVIVPIFIESNIHENVFASTENIALAQQKIQTVTTQIINLATTFAEPILWAFAVMAFITMANNPAKGKEKLKHILIAFIGICMLPGIFSLARYIGGALNSAFGG